jgi:hypothetical protein
MRKGRGGEKEKRMEKRRRGIDEEEARVFP